MFLSLYTYDRKPIRFNKGLPHDLSGYGIPGLSAWHCRAQQGNFILHRLASRPLYSWIAQYRGKSDRQYVVSANFPLLILYHSINGSIRSLIPGLDSADSREGQIDFFYFPPSPFEIVFTVNDHYTCLIIQLPEASINSLVKDSTTLENWLKEIKTEGVPKEHVFANEMIRSLLQDIQYPNLQGALQDKLIKSNIWRLLIETFRLKSKPENDEAIWSFMDQKQKVFLVKEVLLKNIHSQHPPTLDQIAKLTGVNKRKIEWIFEDEYGTTIFGFFKTIQMNMIRNLVTQNRLSIQEIAGLFGYSNHSALSHAFKNSFAVSPVQFRKGKISETKTSPVKIAVNPLNPSQNRIEN